jgi:hypothetical protein
MEVDGMRMKSNVIISALCGLALFGAGCGATKQGVEREL